MDMFFHIASIEREVYWQLGNVVCSAYPLKNLDTIHSEVLFKKITQCFGNCISIVEHLSKNLLDRRAADSFGFKSDCVRSKARAFGSD